MGRCFTTRARYLAAREQRYDVVLIDTAGRMQDNEPLMRALAKLISVNNPDLVLFVGEASEVLFFSRFVIPGPLQRCSNLLRKNHPLVHREVSADPLNAPSSSTLAFVASSRAAAWG